MRQDATWTQCLPYAKLACSIEYLTEENYMPYERYMAAWWRRIEHTRYQHKGYEYKLRSWYQGRKEAP